MRKIMKLTALLLAFVFVYPLSVNASTFDSDTSQYYIVEHFDTDTQELLRVERIELQAIDVTDGDPFMQPMPRLWADGWLMFNSSWRLVAFESNNWFTANVNISVGPQADGPLEFRVIHRNGGHYGGIVLVNPGNTARVNGVPSGGYSVEARAGGGLSSVSAPFIIDDWIF